jgi:hypothetical protein
MNYRKIIYTNSVSNSQEEHYLSTTKTNHLSIFREITVVYCQNHTTHTNALCEQNAEFWNARARDKYSFGCAFNGYAGICPTHGF